MLRITIPETDFWDETSQNFVHVNRTKLQLEHSLVSISKWESKWHKPFLTKENKTTEETIDYIQCMTLTQNVDSNVYLGITDSQMTEVINYIGNPMSATKIPKQKGKANREIITSELIYYWMLSLNIPVEFQKWHLNRLINLIEICNIKNQPPKKMSNQEIMSRNAQLNAARRKQMNSKG